MEESLPYFEDDSHCHHCTLIIKFITTFYVPKYALGMH